MNRMMLEGSGICALRDSKPTRRPIWNRGCAPMTPL